MPYRMEPTFEPSELCNDEADRILADLAELMIRVQSPSLKSILRDTAEIIHDLFGDEDTTEIDAA